MRLESVNILEQAERLASALTGGLFRVERNVLLAVVGDFMADRRPDLERLRKTLRLLRTGSGGHLKRGGAYAKQIEAVTNELERYLAAERPALQIDDLKSVFGWTARLLLVRGIALPSRQQAGARQIPRSDRALPREAPPKAPVPKAFGGLNPKGLSALERLKAQLQERDKDEKT